MFCTPDNVARGLCVSSQLNQFLISDAARSKAKHEFITQAVNLSEPLTFLYPVKGPGLYCTAAIQADGSRFSATMLAVEPRRSIPAFRAGLLSVYRVLAPAWIVLAAVWVAWYWELPHYQLLNSRSSDTIMRWLVPFSAVQIAVRWIGLGNSGGYQTGWTIVWYILDGVQNAAVILQAHRGTTDERTTAYSRWSSYVAAVLLFIITAAASIVDYGADAASRSPAYINSVCGLIIALYLGACTLWLRRASLSVPASSEMLRLPQPATRGAKCETMALSAGYIGLSVLFLGCAAVNAWALTASGSQLEFAGRFWKLRFWMFDAPREWLFLAWLSFLVLHSLYHASVAQHEGRCSREFDDTGEEREWLQGLSEDAADEEKDIGQKAME